MADMRQSQRSKTQLGEYAECGQRVAKEVGADISNGHPQPPSFCLTHPSMPNITDMTPSWKFFLTSLEERAKAKCCHQRRSLYLCRPSLTSGCWMMMFCIRSTISRASLRDYVISFGTLCHIARPTCVGLVKSSPGSSPTDAGQGAHTEKKPPPKPPARRRGMST